MKLLLKIIKGEIGAWLILLAIALILSVITSAI